MTSINTDRSEMRNFGLQHKENGSKRVSLCTAEWERENGTRWEMQAKRRHPVRSQHARSCIPSKVQEHFLKDLELLQITDSTGFHFFPATLASKLNNLRHKWQQAYKCQAWGNFVAFSTWPLKITWHANGDDKETFQLSSIRKYFHAKQLQILVKTRLRGEWRNGSIIFSCDLRLLRQWDDKAQPI